jgi:hypothetical protein
VRLSAGSAHRGRGREGRAGARRLRALASAPQRVPSATSSPLPCEPSAPPAMRRGDHGPRRVCWHAGPGAAGRRRAVGGGGSARHQVLPRESLPRPLSRATLDSSFAAPWSAAASAFPLASDGAQRAPVGNCWRARRRTAPSPSGCARFYAPVPRDAEAKAACSAEGSLSYSSKR